VTFDAIEQLLAEGRTRQYGRRQLITHLSRKYGHRPRGNNVREALQTLDAYGVISRKPGMKKKRQDNYVVAGPDWLWCLDGHDKLSRFGIEMYACVDAFSRKIISALKRSTWFREDLPCDQVVLVFIFMPIPQDEIRD
jgi:hypothetical protein